MIVTNLSDFADIAYDTFNAQTEAHQITLFVLLGIAVFAQIVEWCVDAASDGAAWVVEHIIYAALITDIIFDWAEEGQDYNDV
ncbi:MAG: hypothetical protein ACTSWL_05180, partial [Promethearchaeota archaeon]